MGFLWSLTKVGIKIGLVVGAVKLSIDNDVWSLKTENGSNGYEKLKKYILPGTIVYKEKLPSPEEVKINAGSRWNSSVNSVFEYLNSAPARINSGINSLYRSASDAVSTK
uniref:MICOS complex subunit MIC13 n=1 Tax=Panagrolaimus sp. PS1159 TaxID=55785 RepID=A0AC35G7U2_9BILA